MAPIARLRNLQWLRLYQNHQIDARALETIGSITKLRELDCIDTRIGSGRLAVLRNLPNLRRLVLRLCDVTDDGMPDVGALTQLQHLNLIASKISDAGVSELVTLVNLEHLDLAATQTGDAGVENLTVLQSLKSLDLSETLITDTSLDHVATLNDLQVLELDRTAVTDDGLRRLQNLTRLRLLSVGPNVTLQGINELRSRLPNCHVRFVGPTGVIVPTE